MKQLFAIQTQDPALLGCQLHRVRETLALRAEESIGVGFFVDDDLLLTKKPPEPRPHDLAAMLPGVRSASLVAISGVVEGAFDAEASDPFRFRRWVFGMIGKVEGFDELRGEILEALPSYIARQVGGTSDREHVFALFLRELHELGRIDDPTLSAQEAARCLTRALRTLDDMGRERGRVRPSSLAVAVSNGRLLAAARRGRPLSYGLIEGMASCELCGIQEGGKEEDPSDPRIRTHRRAKAVMLIAEPAAGEGFIEVPDGSTVAVGRGLDISVAPM